MKIFYGRISHKDLNKEEREEFKTLQEYLDYKLQQQEKAVKDFFKVEKFDYCFYDCGSAYKENNFRKREPFLNMLQLIFNSSKITINQLFTAKIKPSEPIFIYIYDYNRLSRIIEYSLLFSVLCDIHDITIFSYNQSSLEWQIEGGVDKKFIKYLFLLLYAKDSEQYSESTSKNTKKSVIAKSNKSNKFKGLTVSYKENVWGKGFVDTKGNRLSPKKTLNLKKDVIRLIKYYEDNGNKYYYDILIAEIENKYKVILKKPLLSRMKKQRGVEK